jgi:hypothetical protein
MRSVYSYTSGANGQVRVHLLIFLLCLCGIRAKTLAQAPLYDAVRLTTASDKFSIAGKHDSSFVKEVLISMKDTSGFKGLQVVLSSKEGSSWSMINTVVLQKPMASALSCETPFCIYRRTSREWVIYLGYYSLLKRYKVELTFLNTSSSPLNYAF